MPGTVGAVRARPSWKELDVGNYTQPPLSLEDDTTPANLKRCPSCDEVKPTTAYHTDRGRPDGLFYYCKDCRATKDQDKYWNTPGEREQRAIVHKRRTYNLISGEYEAMLEAQHGTCAICCGVSSGRRELSVDHDHSTGRVRALLCNNCNAGLGYFQDDPRLMRTAIAYLEKHGK